MTTHILNNDGGKNTRYRLRVNHNENELIFDVPEDKFTNEQILEFFPRFADVLNRHLNTDGTFSVKFDKLV